MPTPTIVSDYIGRTYTYTHPRTQHVLNVHITPSMVGKALDEILDDADKNQSRPFLKRLLDRLHKCVCRKPAA